MSQMLITRPVELIVAWKCFFFPPLTELVLRQSVTHDSSQASIGCHGSSYRAASPTGSHRPAERRGLTPARLMQGRVCVCVCVCVKHKLGLAFFCLHTHLLVICHTGWFSAGCTSISLLEGHETFSCCQQHVRWCKLGSDVLKLCVVVVFYWT